MAHLMGHKTGKTEGKSSAYPKCGLLGAREEGLALLGSCALPALPLQRSSEGKAVPFCCPSLVHQDWGVENLLHGTGLT